MYMADSDLPRASFLYRAEMLWEHVPADRTLRALWGPSVNAQPDILAYSTLVLHMHICKQNILHLLVFTWDVDKDIGTDIHLPQATLSMPLTRLPLLLFWLCSYLPLALWISPLQKKKTLHTVNHCSGSSDQVHNCS